jgi:ornithine carbamoyltransferase
VPLCTGEEDDGEAYLGVVSLFRPADVDVFGVLAAVELAELLELEELELLLLDDPQPATSTSAEQAIKTGKPLLIERSFLGASLGAQLGKRAQRLSLTYTGPSMTRHFLTGAELTAVELHALLDRALELKAAPLSSRALSGKSVALIFQKPSTRTRLSFEVGVHELGGHPVVLRTDELQISRGEALRDTAYVLSRHVAAVGVRTGPDTTLEELAAHSAVPVINMLTERHHPCQALTDLLTLREAQGSLAGARVAYVGDGNNVARSLALLGTLAGVDVAVASPEGYALESELAPLPGATGKLSLHTDPHEAVAGAQAVYTDVWVSMGDEDTADERRRALADYRVDDALLDAAAPGAFALHDLPAHPGEEISAEVLYGERQRIWDQAENRRHAQKALLELLVAPGVGATSA